MSQDEEVLDQDANDQAEETAEQIEAVEPQVDDNEKEPSKEAEATKAEPEKTEERPAWTMPVSKAQEEKKRAVEKAREEAKAESEAEIKSIREDYEARLARGTSTDGTQSELAQFAEEHGLDPEAATGLLDVFKKSLPNLSKYDEIVKQQEIEGYKSKVSADFDEKVLPLIQKDYPSVTSQHIADVKKRVSELAFSEGYNTYRLEDIYRVKQGDFEFKNGFSAETSGGRSSELVDFTKMTDAEEHALADRNPAQYAQYLKEMSKKDSRYID